MQQRLSIITLGAQNLPALKKFYTDKFGWRVEAEAKDIVFFKLNGLLLGLYGRDDLARFTAQTKEEVTFRPFALAYMVKTRQEVEDLYQEFIQKEINIIQPPQEPPFGGYYFLASDIEGNIWEIANNPLMTLDDNGNVTAHSNIDNL